MFIIKSIKDLYIFSDIDGTLYSSKTGISKEHKQAISRFILAGGHFTIATGRAMHKARAIAQQIPVNLPCVVCNGAALYSFEKEEYLHKEFLPQNAIDYCKNIMYKFPNISAVGVTEENYYCLTGKNDLVKFHTDIIYDEFSLENPPSTMFKILFSVPDNQCKGILDYMISQNFNGVDFCATDTFYIDMMPKGVNKGNGILKLCSILDIPQSNTISVGDFYNDIDMLKTTQISACVGNAPEDVKSICDIILCPFEENPIAELIVYLEKNYK